MTIAPPTPPDTDPAAFVAALRRLKAWSGLSYRKLERRASEAGHWLPYSTAASMLGRERLPREELVASFVAACGVRGEAAQAWLDARTAIAGGRAPAPPVRDAPPVHDVSPVQDAPPVQYAPPVQGAPPVHDVAPVHHVPPVRNTPALRTRRLPRSRWAYAGAVALFASLLGVAMSGTSVTDEQEVRQPGMSVPYNESVLTGRP